MVGNFPASTGYAWEMIGGIFKTIGVDFVKKGNMAIVAYPKLDHIPLYYNGSGIKVVEYNFNGSLKNTYRFMKDNDIGIVYLIDQPVISLRYALLKWSGVKAIIIHEHFSIETTTNVGLKKKLTKLFKIVINKSSLLSADRIIVVSHYLKTHLFKNFCVPLKKISVVYNGVDNNDDIQSKPIDIRNYYGIQPDKKIIYCCGRAKEYKGIDLFIKAADELCNKRKNTHLIFMYSGDGPCLEKFKQMVSDYNLNNMFIFTGYVDYVKKILHEVDICVVPSKHQEAFGLIVIEAMRAGIPTIASKVGGMAELMEDGIDGFYVDPGDFIAIANCIETLVTNEIIYNKIASSAKEKAISKYSITSMYTTILNIINEESKRFE